MALAQPAPQAVTVANATGIPDPFGIGQRALAQIAADVEFNALREHVVEAFEPAHLHPEWAAMKRRLFDASLREYRNAQRILEAI